MLHHTFSENNVFRNPIATRPSASIVSKGLQTDPIQKKGLGSRRALGDITNNKPIQPVDLAAKPKSQGLAPAPTPKPPALEPEGRNNAAVDDEGDLLTMLNDDLLSDVAALSVPEVEKMFNQPCEAPWLPPANLQVDVASIADQFISSLMPKASIFQSYTNDAPAIPQMVPLPELPSDETADLNLLLGVDLEVADIDVDDFSFD